MHCLFRFELRWILHVCSILRSEGISRLLVCARKFLGLMDVVKDKGAHIKRCAGKTSKSRWQRRAAKAASGRDKLRKMDGVHAAAAEGFVGILHQPEAIMTVLNHVGRDRDPLTSI